jgi:NADH:ubiquinone oxidoreductase subunit 4 (subunit M)
MLLSILYIYYQVGTTDYEVLLTFSFSELEQKFLFFSFFLAFASKVPMVPVLWLPEAHVEAPTGSVILAGVLLKLGTYGFIRFSLPLFPKRLFSSHHLFTQSLQWVSFTPLSQLFVRLISKELAYTSIAHMNLVILGIFSNTVGLEGAIVQSLSHGFVASALFVIIVVYDRYRTRIVKYYGGLATVMPIYITIFLIFTMANISFLVRVVLGRVFNFSGSFKVNTTITF